MTTLTQITVPFYGSELLIVEHDGQPYIPMRPIVENMGLDWATQFRKLNQKFKTCIVKMTTQLFGDTQTREVILMALKKLPAWLYSIEPNKVNPEIRDTVIKYQEECDDVLWDYWTKGVAVKRPELPTPPQNPRLLLRNTIHAVAKGDRQTYSNLYNRLYRKFQVTSYKELNDNQCVAAIEFIKSVQGEYIPRDKIEAPKPSLALCDGQHYVVAKDGAVLMHKVLSHDINDSCFKTMQQPMLNLQGLDLLKGEVDYWQVRKALNVLNSLIYQYQPYNHVKPVFNIISAAENMLCRLWTMIDESSTRLGYLQAVAKTGKPLDEANMDTLAYIQVALTNRMMKVQMPLC